MAASSSRRRASVQATISAMKCVAEQSRSRTDQSEATAIRRPSARNRSGRNPRGCQRASGHWKCESRIQCSTSSRDPPALHRQPATVIEAVLSAGEPLRQRIQQAHARPDLEREDPRFAPLRAKRPAGRSDGSCVRSRITRGSSYGARSNNHSAKAPTGPPWPPTAKSRAGKASITLIPVASANRAGSQRPR